MARVESAARLALAFGAAFNRHDAAGIAALLSADCLFESEGPAPDGVLVQGREAIARHWQAYFAATPQARLDVEDVSGFGRRCLLRWRRDWVDEAGAARHVRGVTILQEKQGVISQMLCYVKG